MAPQDGLYTLITRAADGDKFELIGSLSTVHPAADHEAYLDYLGAPQTALVTITVTEAAYLRNAEGRLDAERDVIIADLQALRSDPRLVVSSLPARLVAGLMARRDASSGAITILSCDNLPENGAVTETVVTDLAALVDESLLAWMERNVDFATSMVDRITPATTDEDRRIVESTRATSTPLRCLPSPSANGWCRAASRPDDHAGKMPAPSWWTMSNRSSNASCGC